MDGSLVRQWGSVKQAPLVLLLLAVAGLAIALTVQQTALRRAELGRDSAEVARDSSRTFWVGQARVAARRAYQGQVELLHALQQGRATGATLVAVRLERDSLQRITAGQVTHDTAAHTITAHGELAAESLGVGVRADVTVEGVAPVPGAPVTSQFAWQLTREPIPLDVALVCLPGHRAEARVTGPTWAALTVQGAASRDDICYERPSWSPLSLRPPSLLWLGGAFVLGWFAH